MSFIKSKLKLARDSIGKTDFAAARDAANQVLEYEPENYTAHVFLGLALLKLNHLDESEQVYRKAIKLSPEQILAWQGLSQLYEQIGSQDKLLETLETLCQLHANVGDPTKTAECVQKIIGISRHSADRLKLIATLSYLLPDSPFYVVLSKLPPPDPTNPTATTISHIQAAVYNDLPILEEIVTLIEKQEISDIEREVERRRMRLASGGPEKIRREVGREIWAKSRLPYLYSQILNHPNTSDELRRKTESTLLRYKMNYLYSLPITEEHGTSKRLLREEVDELIQGAILLQVPDELAWTLYMEEQDHETMAEYDFLLMKQMIRLLPTSTLARAFMSYFKYISEPIHEGKDLNLIEEEGDPFEIIMNIWSASQDKVLICRIAAEVCLKEEDYENTSQITRRGLRLLEKLQSDSGKTLSRTQVGLQAILATALTHFFPPKHHHQALPIISEALSVSPNNIRCLFSHAYILQAAGQWESAAVLFAKIAGLLPEDMIDGLRAREEQAWCHWQATSDENSIDELKVVAGALEDITSREHDTARCIWRIGECFWRMGGQRREGAYPYYINALKRDPLFARAFTSLGFYYSEVPSPPDLLRSSKCFQKAFELDPQEHAAARRLAEGFAEHNEWDLVEVVAKRTIEGEGGADDSTAREPDPVITKFIPINAWAWKAIGIIEMSRQGYIPAIQAFQIALRAEPENSLSWLRLGEAYSKAGRHAAAVKALNHALELDPENWLCFFLIGKLKQETGLAQEAILTFEAILDRRPNEVGALTALAQAHLSLAQAESDGGYYIRAEASLFNAVNVALTIIEGHPGFRGMAWKVISDATLRLSRRPTFQDEKRAKHILGALKSLLSTERGIIHLAALSEFESSDSFCFLGISIHSCNLRLGLNTSSSAALGSAWYDLAVALQLQTCNTSAPPQPEIGEKIIDAVTNALREEPSSELYWNAFGNAHFVAKPKVAQHAYIKALELNSKNVGTWANLGFLYYHHGDLELSNETFYRAQVIDPDYSLAWLGQALIATANGHDSDAETLLTYATTLTTSHPETDFEFAIKFFRPQIPRRRLESAIDLIPCFFALDRYCSRRPSDASGLHLFSLVCECIGHIDLAISLAVRAITILEARYEVSEDAMVERQFAIANMTLGRLLLSTHECRGSIESFQSALGLLSGDEGTGTKVGAETKTLRVQGHLGLALAHFMLEDYQTSLNASQEALNVAGDDLAAKSQITVLFAQTLWALGAEEMREAAKSQLLEYIAIDPENLVAINALAGMGIVTADEGLVDAALSEVLGLPIDRRQELDANREADYLLVQQYLSHGKIDGAIAVAQKEVVSEPAEIEPRLRLATLMIQKGERKAALALLADAISGDKNDLTLTSTALILHAVALICPEATKDEKVTSLREVQRAIMLRPSNLRTWQALAYVRACAA